LKGVDSSIGSSISYEYDRHVKANVKWSRNIVTDYHGVYTHHKWLLKLGVPKRTWKRYDIDIIKAWFKHD